MAAGQIFGTKARGAVWRACTAGRLRELRRHRPIPPRAGHAMLQPMQRPDLAIPRLSLPVGAPHRSRHHRRGGVGAATGWAASPSASAATSSSGMAAAATREMSQHLTDWYTYSHVLHGIIFYWLLSVVSRGRLSVAARLVIAVADRGRLGGLREHALHHQPLSHADDLARLLRRQHRQLGRRHAGDAGGLPARRAAAGLGDGVPADRHRGDPALA